MIDISTVIKLADLILTFISVGIQLATYINSKNDRRSRKD